jgi:6-pyruvoyltetrahydropterin/6-carboxytetrahydropterin synthase
MKRQTFLWIIQDDRGSVISVTRKYNFSASHRLHVEGLSETENDEIFGKCNNPYGHGHNYELFVTARGPVDAESGLAVDTRKLDGLIREHILSAFHLKNMNADVPAFRVTVPTTENVGLEIQRMIREGWSETFPGQWPVFEKVRIYETDRNIFEVSNEKA